jgi:hypothetical protein
MGDVIEQPPFVADPLAFAGGRYRLAGEACGQNVDRVDLGPVHGGDVAEVGHVRPVGRQDAGGVGVDLGEPGDFSAEHFVHGQVETAVSRAHRTDSHGDRSPVVDPGGRRRHVMTE